LCSSVPGLSQEYTKSDREFAQRMLHDVAADVQKNYYDWFETFWNLK
jgi:hypothetical protein